MTGRPKPSDPTEQPPTSKAVDPLKAKWYVEEGGRFCSFWPPAYTGCYNLKWLVERSETAGVRFVEVDTGGEFTGRYFSKKT